MSILEPADAARTIATVADATLASFVETHYPRLIRLAGLVCDDHALAQDAVQAGLERAWSKRASLHDPDRLQAWVDRIVVREAIRASRTKRSWLSRLFPPVWEIESEVVDLRRPSAPDDEWLDLRVAFQRLSPDQRAVVALHLYQGYSIAETADLVGAPIETVRSRLRLARERLRAAAEEAPR